VLTNAAGGINAGYAVGQPVLISDHINLTGRSPLAGPLPEDVPSRFTDLTETYSGRLRGLARQLDPTLAEGVYAAVPGPHFETPAEIRMLRAAGADLVGMSTALEAIAARHLGAEVLGVSIASNPAAGLSPEPINHRDVLAATQGSAARVGELLSALLPRV
jgi:purine-nucleoside phosphorylase